MAAKQGLGAQFAQAGEDAKRAVLSRTGVTSSTWFSNLNTVCTIKSAPPRSPEVLQMLSTKSGWLYKRNEQHVWQARWCCVVPHTFLYYFDASHGPPPQGNGPPGAVGGGGGGGNGGGGAAATANGGVVGSQPTQQQQEEWNSAVLAIGSKNQHRKHHEKRSNYFFYSSPAQPPQPSSGTNASSSTTPTTGQHGPNGANHGGNGAAGGPSYSMGGHGTMDENETGDFLTASASSKNFANQQHLQPTGIIDLECYSQVHRSRENPLVLELAGDDSVNPDLRAFYFCAGNLADSESWTDALLNGRHAALVDECDAYKQVCDGFAQQLQVLHSELDQANTSLDEAKEELYSVRCHTEDSRRSCWRLLEECLVEDPRKKLKAIEALDSTDRQHQQQPAEDRQPTPNEDASSHGRASPPSQPVFLAAEEGVNPMEQRRRDCARNLESLRSQDTGLVAAFQLLCNYTASLHQVYDDLYAHTQSLQADMKASGQSDQARVEELAQELQNVQSQYEADQNQWQQQVEALTAKYQQSQKELQDVQKDLSSTRMEMTMYQAQQRTKTSELTQHKKILKKEVMDLRGKLEHASAELSNIKLQEAASQMRAEQERQKNSLLERYVEKMESQVKVQQNMMELMSQTGSVYGGGGGVPQTVGAGGSASIVGSHRGYSNDTPHHNNNTDDRDRDDDDDDCEDVDVDDDHDRGDRDCHDHVESPRRQIGIAAMQPSPSRQRLGNASNMMLHRRNTAAAAAGMATNEDVDNKSHVSELTEDRTQRQFEAMTREYSTAASFHHHHSHLEHSARNRPLPNATPNATTSSSPSRPAGPPRYIIGVNSNNSGGNDGGNGGSCSASVPHTPPTRRSDIPKSSHHSANHNIGGGGGGGGGGGDSSSTSGPSESRRKLSVAQRARMDADRQTTPVRVRVDDVTVQAAVVQRRGKNRDGQDMQDGAASKSSQQPQPSTTNSSTIWQRMEVAVLGHAVGSSSDDDDDDDDEEGGANDGNPGRGGGVVSMFRGESHATRVVKHPRTLGDGGHSDDGVLRNGEVVEEKKSTDSVATQPLTLKERSELQRAKQLEFLKNQGLIKDESDVKGGAGAVGDSPSVSSTGNSSLPRSARSISSSSPKSLARLGSFHAHH